MRAVVAILALSKLPSNQVQKQIDYATEAAARTNGAS
jgi:hypothetical protein